MQDLLHKIKNINSPSHNLNRQYCIYVKQTLVHVLLLILALLSKQTVKQTLLDNGDPHQMQQNLRKSMISTIQTMVGKSQFDQMIRCPAKGTSWQVFV